jgi:hypothetical protein
VAPQTVRAALARQDGAARRLRERERQQAFEAVRPAWVERQARSDVMASAGWVPVGVAVAVAAPRRDAELPVPAPGVALQAVVVEVAAARREQRALRSLVA